MHARDGATQAAESRLNKDGIELICHLLGLELAVLRYYFIS